MLLQIMKNNSGENVFVMRGRVDHIRSLFRLMGEHGRKEEGQAHRQSLPHLPLVQDHLFSSVPSCQRHVIGG